MTSLSSISSQMSVMRNATVYNNAKQKGSNGAFGQAVAAADAAHGTSSVTAPGTASNSPQNLYAQVLDASGKPVANIFKSGVVSTSNAISQQVSGFMATDDNPADRAAAIAKITGGTVKLADPAAAQ